MVAGITLWLAAASSFALRYGWHDQLVVIALSPLAVITGMFPNTIPLPAGRKRSQEKLTFTLSDALVLLIACQYGIAASQASKASPRHAAPCAVCPAIVIRSA